MRSSQQRKANWAFAVVCTFAAASLGCSEKEQPAPATVPTGASNDAAGFKISTDNRTLAWAADTVGRRFYTLRFRDLATGEDLPDVIPDVTGNHAWAADGRTLFYTKQDPETLRWHRVYRHVLGTDPAEDELVYEETDEEFGSWVYKTKSGRYLVIHNEQTLASEALILD